MSIFSYITIISALLITLLVLVQTRGASLGAGLGGSGEVNMTRRGADKTLHQMTIIVAIIFAASLVLGLLK